MAKRDGFTLVELLIVVVIIGILATVATAQFAQAREKAFSAALKNDLKVLATHQELYHAQNIGYADRPDLKEFRESDGVQVSVTHFSSAGWAATAHHTSRPSEICGLFIGTVPSGSTGPATLEGEIACTN